MKNFLFLFLISYYFCKEILDLEMKYLKKYDSIKTNLTDAGICVELKDIENNRISYLKFYSKDGTINQTLKYEYLYNECYVNYTYDEDNNSLSSIDPYSKTLYKEEFTYEYEFERKENATYIFAIYFGYNGTELTISLLEMKSKTILIIFLGIFAGFVVLLIIICFICYKICKRNQHFELHKSISALDYKNTFDS